LKRLLVLLLFGLLGCGVKAPPRPPDLLLPHAPKGLKLMVREGLAYLTWEAPEDARYLYGFHVLMKEEGSEGFLTIGKVPYCQGKKGYRFDLKGLSRGKRYVFKVMGINKWGYPGPPSEEVALRWVSPPVAPLGLSAEAGDKEVKLSWQPMSGVAFFHVYRRVPPSGFPEDPIGIVEANSFLDQGLQNRVLYCYQVRATIMSEDTPIEGIGTEEVCTIPEDKVPPPAPSGLSVLKKEGMIELDWFPVETEPVKGYHVWRGRCGGPFERLTDVPVERTFFVDHPPAGGCWVYGVTALDLEGNESKMSELIQVDL